MNTNDFINSIDNKLYNKIRQSKSDAECRIYLKEHLTKQLKLYGVGVTLPCERTDAEEYLNDLDIYHHPRVEDRTNQNSYEVADIMADFTNKYLGN
ncbi:MAG: hypothetical protein KDD03_00685 [Gelidibacter sp.]|nr:hypothetical protein [Gelidibacter sp.]